MDYTLYTGDCLAILPTLDAGSVDAVVTDPPYSSVTHAGARSRNSPASGTSSLVVEPTVEFASIDEPTFLRVCRECLRVARRWVVMTCDWQHAALAERELGAAFVRCGVWVKPDAAPQFTGDRPGTGWESVLLLHRPGKKRWNGGGHHGVWTFPVERANCHPTQKPLGLVREWVRLFSDPGETVLDPFTGSGTTGVACKMEGRKFIGIELDPEYVEIARGRLGELVNRPGERTLFDSPV